MPLAAPASMLLLVCWPAASAPGWQAALTGSAGVCADVIQEGAQR
jgi:hypothetical protein